jgi:hypothetical protein
MKNKDELVMANLVGSVVGIDTLLNSYFNNDSSYVLRALMENTADMEDSKKMLEEIEYNYQMRSKTKKSNLGTMQAKFIKMYGNIENIEELTNHIITNENMIKGKDEIEYPALSEGLKEAENIYSNNLDKVAS